MKFLSRSIFLAHFLIVEPVLAAVIDGNPDVCGRQEALALLASKDFLEDLNRIYQRRTPRNLQARYSFDDLVQDTAEELLTKDIEISRDAGKSPRAFLVTMVSNRLVDRYRKSLSNREVDFTTIEGGSEQAFCESLAADEGDLGASEGQAVIDIARSRLDPSLAEAVSTCLNGQTLESVALSTGQSRTEVLRTREAALAGLKGILVADHSDLLDLEPVTEAEVSGSDATLDWLSEQIKTHPVRNRPTASLSPHTRLDFLMLKLLYLGLSRAEVILVSNLSEGRISQRVTKFPDILAGIPSPHGYFGRQLGRRPTINEVLDSLEEEELLLLHGPAIAAHTDLSALGKALESQIDRAESLLASQPRLQQAVSRERQVIGQIIVLRLILEGVDRRELLQRVVRQPQLSRITAKFKDDFPYIETPSVIPIIRGRREGGYVPLDEAAEVLQEPFLSYFRGTMLNRQR